MYELFIYSSRYVNIRNILTGATSGCCDTFYEAVNKRNFHDNVLTCKELSCEDFCKRYNCVYLVTVNTLDEIFLVYPEFCI